MRILKKILSVGFFPDLLGPALEHEGEGQHDEDHQNARAEGRYCSLCGYDAYAFEYQPSPVTLSTLDP